jgi:carbonic anhydrase/acetyltransferase-like protein (isoleucine patch superfamily)
MALIKKCRNNEPKIPASCWLAENATIVGDVEMGENCSIWFNAVVRGDVNSIRFGDNVNIQDGAVIHCTYENLSDGLPGTKTTLGNNVSVGHNALVHGCTVANNVLIGMGSIVMDNCVIEENCIIAAGAVLLEGTRVESGSIYAGVPAKKVKDLSPEKFKGEVMRIAKNYRMYASWFEE